MSKEAGCTEKYKRCVEHVKDTGKSEESAHAICNVSLKKKKKRKSSLVGEFPEFERDIKLAEEEPFRFRLPKVHEQMTYKEFPGKREELEDLGEPTPVDSEAAKVLIDESHELMRDVEIALKEAKQVRAAAEAKAKQIQKDKDVAGKQDRLRVLAEELGNLLDSPEIDDILYSYKELIIRLEDKIEESITKMTAKQELNVVMAKVKEIGGNFSRAVTQSTNAARRKIEKVKKTPRKEITVFPRTERESSFKRAWLQAFAIAELLESALELFVKGFRNLLGFKDDIAEARAMVEAL